MCQLFIEIYRACGLKDASNHSGLRTYITRLANKGVGVRLLAELAGHSHISKTQRYINVNADQLREAVELVKAVYEDFKKRLGEYSANAGGADRVVRLFSDCRIEAGCSDR